MPDADSTSESSLVASSLVREQFDLDVDDEAVLAEAVRVALERHQRRRPDATSPTIILIWLLWLMGTWGVSLYLDGTHRALRWMAFGCMTGLVLVWPAVRLSLNIGGASVFGKRDTFRPGVSTLAVDWFGMLAVLMAVIAVLAVPAQWHIEQVFWLAATYLAWSLLVSAIIYLGSRSRGGRLRTASMVTCITLMFAEPALQTAMSLVTGGIGSNWTMWVSPLEAVWAMTVPAVEWRPEPWPIRVKAIGIAATVLWLVALTLTRGRRWRPSLVASDDPA